MMFVLRAVVRLYQLCISPMLGCNCRFIPSCSEYAHQAITQHGSCKGGWMTLKRIMRCHPFGGEGYDPVSKRISK
ncbi:MAG: membrane protein insertion efficiency factor YidD [Rickettsiales bacterium]|nr:membrane protein insertion efficiency factor YidD [Rickettsiales bacterium]